MKLFCEQDPVALGIEGPDGSWDMLAFREHVAVCPHCGRLVQSIMGMIGSITSPRKSEASRRNGRLGGRPPGSGGLTLLQRQVLDLRRRGLSVREIAHQLGRRPENVRQILARIARKENIPGG